MPWYRFEADFHGAGGHAEKYVFLRADHKPWDKKDLRYEIEHWYDDRWGGSSHGARLTVTKLKYPPRRWCRAEAKRNRREAAGLQRRARHLMKIATR